MKITDRVWQHALEFGGLGYRCCFIWIACRLVEPCSLGNLWSVSSSERGRICKDYGIQRYSIHSVMCPGALSVPAEWPSWSSPSLAPSLGFAGRVCETKEMARLGSQAGMRAVYQPLVQCTASCYCSCEVRSGPRGSRVEA